MNKGSVYDRDGRMPLLQSCFITCIYDKEF